MDLPFSLKSAYDPVRQPVIGTFGEKIIFANPAAIAVFGISLCEKTPDQIFPPEIIENQSPSFMCSAKICGKHVSAFTQKHEGITLHYIDNNLDTSGPLFLTRRLLSHLRNCVTGIKISADRCFSKFEDNTSPNEKLISIFYHYYYRLVRTIIQLDSADKLERKEMAFSPRPINLVALCAELTDTLKSLTREKEIKISFSSESDSLIAPVDASLIELMLLNLFSNSLKNTEAGDSIEFGIKQAQNKIVISLDDNGRGVSQDELGDIFSLPADSINGGKPDEGVGLGLYISHEIVQLHNGALLFESREGEGVHIRILLPIAEGSEASLCSPAPDYGIKSISPILTGLSDVLSSRCYGPKYED